MAKAKPAAKTAAKAEAQLPAVQVPTGPAPVMHIGSLSVPATFKAARALTFPQMKWGKSETKIGTFLSGFKKKPDLKIEGRRKLNEDGAPSEPPIVAEFILWNDDGTSDGVVYEMVINSVLMGIMEENFPVPHASGKFAGQPGFVGRTFHMVSRPPDEGRNKRYRTFAVTELDLSDQLRKLGIL